jgi:NAD(P)H-flavin reductase
VTVHGRPPSGAARDAGAAKRLAEEPDRPSASTCVTVESVRHIRVATVRATIKEKREVAKGTLLVVFDLLGEEFDYQPGQYFWVELLDPPYEDEKGPRRHISAVTSPTERGVIGLCTRIRDSAFKRSLAELPLGAEVEVEPPRGKFVLPEDASHALVFVAGGIGITAFRSMLRYIQDEGLPHRVTLIYSNRDRESTPFLDELEEIERTNTRVRFILTMTDDEGWAGERRRVDANFFKDYLGSGLNDARYMVAGPPGMAEAATDELKKTGVDEHLISTDSFSGY